MAPRTVIGFAHRGARAHAPENTIEAFLTALRMGAVALETDVWLTRDGVAVIDHDGRAAPGVPIRAVDFADLPGHMPALADLDALLEPDIDLSIDVKDPDAVGAILEVRAAAAGRTWLCDPDPERLASWRALDGQVRLVASLGRGAFGRSTPAEVRAAGVDVINLRHHRWSHRRIEATHRAGLSAFAWGVQSPWRMRRLVASGIDGLYSDHTDRLVRVLQPSQVTERPDDDERTTDQRRLGNRTETP